MMLLQPSDQTSHTMYMYYNYNGLAPVLISMINDWI